MTAWWKLDTQQLPDLGSALPGRDTPLVPQAVHPVLGTTLVPPYPEGSEEIWLGLGCFWGAERLFWRLEGVHTTAVGYAGGLTPNPTYEEVCTGATGHTEVVRVVFFPERLPLETVLSAFWEGHDPTQGMRQGNDRGTQYRSAVYFTEPAQEGTVRASRDRYAAKLAESGFGEVTTEIAPARDFYFAEEYHQQYLHKNPIGYCGLGGTGVSCPMPAGAADTGSP